MAAKKDEAATVTMEGVRLIFRNFAGEEGQYNPKGSRNFAVVIPEAEAKKMLRDNWNVKQLDPREEGDEGTWYLPVAVSFKNYPPRITVITSISNNRTVLSESQVEVLDWAEIENVDLIVRAYNWSANGKGGVKAYLKTMFVTIKEDELEQKYAVTGGE